MKPRSLAILVTLAFIMGGFIFFIERDLPSTDERREQEKKIVPVEADEVTALTLRGTEHELRLVKEGRIKEGDAKENGDLGSPTWRLEKPIDARANITEVEGLISQLIGLEKSRTLENIDPEQLGLEAPRASAVVETGDRSFEVRIGADLPLSAGVVVQGNERDVAFQVSGAAGLIDEINRDVDTWRDRSLFETERADIASVTLEGQAGRLQLVRRGDGEDFWLAAPIDDRADTQDVSGLLSTITGLEAAAFLDAAPDGVELGLDQAQVIEVQVSDAAGPWRLEIGHASDALSLDGSRRYARLDGQLLEIDAVGLEAPLAKSAVEWRSRAWSSMQVFKVETATFTLDGESMTIRRASGEWLRETDDAGEVKIDYTAASDALYPLTEVRATELLDPNGAASQLAGSPRLEIQLVASDGAEERLDLYAASGEVAAATLEGRDAVLLLSTEDANKILEKVKALRDAEPYVEPEGESESEPAADS